MRIGLLVLGHVVEHNCNHRILVLRDNPFAFGIGTLNMNESFNVIVFIKKFSEIYLSHKQVDDSELGILDSIGMDWR